jgi:hypothetical protein
VGSEIFFYGKMQNIREVSKLNNKTIKNSFGSLGTIFISFPLVVNEKPLFLSLPPIFSLSTSFSNI